MYISIICLSDVVFLFYNWIAYKTDKSIASGDFEGNKFILYVFQHNEVESANFDRWLLDWHGPKFNISLLD